MAEEKSGGLVAGRAVEICANIDDMTGEDLGAAMELLLSAGALDVWFEQIQMKKKPSRGEALRARAARG